MSIRTESHLAQQYSRLGMRPVFPPLDTALIACNSIETSCILSHVTLVNRNSIYKSHQLNGQLHYKT